MNAVLVGTGDNFAPQLEARIFGKPRIARHKTIRRGFMGHLTDESKIYLSSENSVTRRLVNLDY